MLKIFGKLGRVVAAPVTLPISLINGKITQYAETVITGQMRHCISIGAGWLIGQGILQGSDEEKFIGAAMGIFSMLLSAGEKKLLKTKSDT